MSAIALLQLVKLVQAVLPDLAKAWRNIHSNDPAKQNMTDAEAFADLVASDDVADKWEAYHRDNP